MRKPILFLLLTLALTSVVRAQYERYENYKPYEKYLSYSEEEKLVKEFWQSIIEYLKNERKAQEELERVLLEQKSSSTSSTEIGGLIEYGLMSWYGPGFHGRPMSNGQIFDMYKVSGAHKIRPLNNEVRVTNLHNGKSAIVRITDRGPYVQGRIFDASYALAQELEFVKEGITPVKIEDWPPVMSGIAQQWTETSTGQFIWPVAGRTITQWPRTGHVALDIDGRASEPVWAAASGRVIVSTYSSGDGNYVIIDHGNSFSTVYKHLSQRNVPIGRWVNQGEIIGLIGSTGYSTGSHLHFEIRKNGIKVNPLSYLGGNKS